MCVDSGGAACGCSSGPSASRNESTDLPLRRKGARRWKLPGEWGICRRALWEGTTASPGHSQGGTPERMPGLSSGENAGLSIPRREGGGRQLPSLTGRAEREAAALGQTAARPRPHGRSPGRSRASGVSALRRLSLASLRAEAFRLCPQLRGRVNRAPAPGPPARDHLWVVEGRPPHLRGSLSLCPARCLPRTRSPHSSQHHSWGLPQCLRVPNLVTGKAA